MSPTSSFVQSLKSRKMSFTKQFVAMTMAALRADGKIDSVELSTIKEMASWLEMDPDEVNASIVAEMEDPSDLDTVIKSVEGDEERLLVLEACVQVVLADDNLAAKEVRLLLDICRKLQLPEEQMVMALAMVCQNDRGIHIEGSDSDFEDTELIEEE